MAVQTVAQLKQWFETGDYPTQQQFWDWLDSYRHKGEGVPVADVMGLVALLQNKADLIGGRVPYSQLPEDIGSEGSTAGAVPLSGTTAGNGMTGAIEVVAGIAVDDEATFFNNQGNSEKRIVFDQDTDAVEIASIGKGAHAGQSGRVVAYYDKAILQALGLNGTFANFIITQDRALLQVAANSRGITVDYDLSDNVQDFDYVQKKFVDDKRGKCIGYFNAGSLNGIGYFDRDLWFNFTTDLPPVPLVINITRPGNQQGSREILLTFFDTQNVGALRYSSVTIQRENVLPHLVLNNVVEGETILFKYNKDLDRDEVITHYKPNAGGGGGLNPDKYKVNQPLTGTVDGTNTLFTLPHIPIVGTQTIFLRGLLADESDYTIDGEEVNFLAAPQLGDKIYSTYFIL